TILRKMFNDGKYWEQVKHGTLRYLIVADNHRSSPRAREPICTRSQYIIYIDKNGKKVAGVHQYLRPDGKIGASGLPTQKNYSLMMYCTYLKRKSLVFYCLLIQ